MTATQGFMPFAGFLLDGLILVLLGVMIFYALRLSASLQRFRENRAALGALLEDLSNTVAHAEHAILALKTTARDSGGNLESLMSRAKGLSEELLLINEAGESLASRLESLAGVAGESVSARAAESVSSAARRTPKERMGQKKPSPPLPDPDSGSGSPSMPPRFSIRDPEFETPPETEAHSESRNGTSPESGGTFSSKAERDLYEALRKNHDSPARSPSRTRGG